MKMLDSGYLPRNGFDWQFSSYCVGCNNKKSSWLPRQRCQEFEKGEGPTVDGLISTPTRGAALTDDLYRGTFASGLFQSCGR